MRLNYILLSIACVRYCSCSCSCVTAHRCHWCRRHCHLHCHCQRHHHTRVCLCVCTSISCKIHNNSHMHSTYRACITCISYIFALDGPKMLSASHFPHFEKMCAIECFHILSWLGSIRLCALCASLSNPIFC